MVKYGNERYGFEVAHNGMTSLLNFISLPDENVLRRGLQIEW
jgi:hypothetical protein